MRALSKIFAIAVLSLVAACGGSSDPGPQPLSQRFDEMHIAAVDLGQKQAVVDANQNWQVAKMQNAKAEADYNEITSQLAVVNNDRKATRLAIDSAISNKKTAEQSSDTNRINAAQKELRNAELLAKAADARVKYYEAYRGYLKKHWRAAQENMYWREAQFELAKAQVAQKNNIAPRGVSFEALQKQEAERNKRAQTHRERAEQEKQRAASARDAWLKQQQVADQENGRPSSHPDPMGGTAQSSVGGGAGAGTSAP